MGTKLRYQRTNTCGECGSCSSGTLCDPARDNLRNYAGIRFTSDGFDCALPVSIDSFSHCSYACDYCFADNLSSHREQTRRGIGRTPLKSIESLFAGKGGKRNKVLRQALKYDNRNKEGYPCPVQLGAICDPLDNIERQQGWLLDFIDLAIKYRQPVRISTKGKLALVDEYLDAFSKAPELFWVTFSIISPDDELLPQVDRGAPTPSERIESMRRLSDAGVKTSLRFRPIIPGLSDSTPNHPEAYKDLIRMSSNAGAEAISYEVMFLSGMATKDIKERYRNMEKVTGIPLRKIYAAFGKKEPCMRPSYKWTEGIMHAIKNEAVKEGMHVGVSDPVWAQLGDEGCCCGIPGDDPVFGNWERQTAKLPIIESRKGNKDRIYMEDVIPPWAHNVLKGDLCAPGAGPKALYDRRHTTWANALEKNWNSLERGRSVQKYFQGAVKPVDVDKNKNLVYRYVGLEKTGKKRFPFWKL